jgi:hypothetical protein
MTCGAEVKLSLNRKPHSAPGGHALNEPGFRLDVECRCIPLASKTSSAISVGQMLDPMTASPLRKQSQITRRSHKACNVCDLDARFEHIIRPRPIPEGNPNADN